MDPSAQVRQSLHDMWCFVYDRYVHLAHARWVWVRLHVMLSGWEEWRMVPTHWLCFEGNRYCAMVVWYDPNE